MRNAFLILDGCYTVVWRIGRRFAKCAGWVLLMFPGWVWADQAYVPMQRDQVLYVLPRTPFQSHLNVERVDATRDPAAAVALATKLILEGRRNADARAYGYAEAVLRPWLNKNIAERETDTAIRLRWADILQHRHDFEAALAVLDPLIVREPSRVEALLMRAAVRLARGEFTTAAQDCRALLGRASMVVVTTCVGQTVTKIERVPAAITAIQRSLADEDANDVDTRVWALTVLAELASRKHDGLQVEQALKTALAMSPSNVTVLCHYSDWLLDQGRSQNVLSLLEGSDNNEGVLLRRALAHNKPLQNNSDALALSARFDQFRQRGEFPPGREYVRFLLAFSDDSLAALDAALINWRIQREIADAKLVLMAAAAAKRPQAAGEVEHWLRVNDLADVIANINSGTRGSERA